MLHATFALILGSYVASGRFARGTVLSPMLLCVQSSSFEEIGLATRLERQSPLPSTLESRSRGMTEQGRVLNSTLTTFYFVAGDDDRFCATASIQGIPSLLRLNLNDFVVIITCS
jgi:hypothetical protein